MRRCANRAKLWLSAGLVAALAAATAAPAAGKAANPTSRPAGATSQPATRPAKPVKKPREPKPSKRPKESAKAAPAPQPTPEEAKEIAALIERLGAADWKVREEATKKLMAFGLKAKGALEAKAKTKDLDPEIASRIELVLDELPGDKSVTDAASGITVSIGDKGTSVLAHNKGGRMIWKTMLGGLGAKALKISAGRVTVEPAGYVIDLATGKITAINRNQGGIIRLGVGANLNAVQRR